MTSSKLHPALALLLCLAAALLFIRLGSSEIQSWDEGLYVVRADAALQFHEWIDQTPHSPGGLYSSTHPPVGIWLMAISELVFGRNEWAFRLPGAMLAALSVFLLYRLLRERSSPSSAALVTLALSSAAVFVHLSRHAQLDIYLYFFVLLSLVLYARGAERSWILRIVLPALAFAAALLSKFGFALFLAPLFLAVGPQVRVRDAAYVVILASVIAAPWYVWMRLHHSEFGGHAVSVVSDASYEATGHAWWFYINQIMVAIPLVAILGFPSTLRSIRSNPWPLLALAVVVIVLLTMATTLAAYALLFWLPLALMLAPALDALFASDERVQLVAISLVAALWLWGLSEQFRMLLKGIHDFTVILLPLEGAMAALLAIIVIVWMRRQPLLRVTLAAMLAITVGQRLYYSLFVSSPESGAKAIVSKLDSIHALHPVNIVGDTPHDELAPQLAYYTAGATLGWPNTRPIAVERANDVTQDPRAFDAAIVERVNGRLDRITPEERVSWSRLDSLLVRRYNRVYRAGYYQLYYSTPGSVAPRPD